MTSRTALAAALVLACATAGAQSQPKSVFVGKEEILFLDDLADPQRWGPSECTVSVSEELQADGRATLLMHIPVDHHGGEKKYPIGWPRMYTNLRRPAETGWDAFDRVEFLVYTKMSRPGLPKNPLNFQIHCPDKRRAHYRQLAELKLDEWVRISIPTSKIAHVADAARLGLNISESSYQDKDVLDFYIGGFRLVRSAECELSEMRVKTPVLYHGSPEIRVELTVVGPPERVSRGMPFTVRCGDDVLRRETLPVRRGLQVLNMDVAELRLALGEYALVAFAGDAEREKTGTFRVVETPWKEKK